MKNFTIARKLQLVGVMIIVGVLFIMGCDAITNDDDDDDVLPDIVWEDVEHCLAWGDNLDRNSLMVVCVDFVNQSLNCNWQVQSDLSLAVWTDDINNASVMPCTKKIIAQKMLR